MRLLIFSLLFCFAISAYAEDPVVVYEAGTPLNVLQLFIRQNAVYLNTLPDLIDREETVNNCIEEYVKKQSKSYSKIVQHNLYDLMHNFNRIALKIYNKKQQADDISYSEKIEVLGQVQCEAYYAMGALK